MAIELSQNKTRERENILRVLQNNGSVYTAEIAGDNQIGLALIYRGKVEEGAGTPISFDNVHGLYQERLIDIQQRGIKDHPDFVEQYNVTSYKITPRGKDYIQ